ncbi:MAG: acylneuraminate cytidylyltransferase family protein [Anaerolineales bacterium]|nr:acylneuraminate cytidylyltransferase family protein [Anaerolineales bacterium]
MKLKVLGIIPARSGSKGIPGKNVRLLNGKPLIQYTAEAAHSSKLVDRLILTTDSQTIADTGRNLGIEVPFLRPSELAQDDTPMLPVIEHVLQFLESQAWRPDIILLLQPTAPLRLAEHIEQAISLLLETKCESVVSVVEVPRHYVPDFVLRLEEGRLKPFLDAPLATRRQDARPAYSRDGTIYAFRYDMFVAKHNIYGDDCRPLIIPESLSCNLDTMEDWQMAEKKILEFKGLHQQ